MKIKIQKNVNILTEQEVHTVSKGETLSGIGKRYGMDWRQIAKANNIQGPKFIIRPGQKLKLQAGALPNIEPDTEEEDSLEYLAQKYFMSLSKVDKRQLAASFISYIREEDPKFEDIYWNYFLDTWNGWMTRFKKGFEKAVPEGVYEDTSGDLGCLATVAWASLSMRPNLTPEGLRSAPKNLRDNISASYYELPYFIEGFKEHCLGMLSDSLEFVDEIRDAAIAAYNKPKVKITLESKIFERYFTKNKHLLEQEMYELPVNDEFEEEIASAIEAKLDDNSVNDLVKNQNSAEQIYALVLQSLKNPERMRTTINSIVDDIFDQIPKSPDQTA